MRPDVFATWSSRTPRWRAPACGCDGRSARFLLVSGRPLDEPISRHGPFVMTTHAQISQALHDLRSESFVWREDPDWARRRQTPAA